MKASDWTRFILVLLIFALMHTFIILAVQIENIKKNWPIWKCNPIIMPLAGQFGHDEFTNFTECIQSMQTNYMDYLLGPINVDLSAITQLGTMFTDGLQGSFEILTSLQTLLATIFENIYGVFYLVIIEFQKMVINIKDIFAKIGGMFTILSYLLEGLGITIASLRNSPVGEAVEAACFDPNTKIQLINNEVVAMKDIKLNSKLKNGSIVRSVMKINNLDSKQNIRENMYEIPGGEINETIYVTGSHLIYDDMIKQFIEVRHLRGSNPSVVSDKNCGELCCLITSDHTIPIGKWVFHDWEDNNGSKSKSV